MARLDFITKPQALVPPSTVRFATVDVGRLRTGDERDQRGDLVGVSIPIKRNGRLLGVAHSPEAGFRSVSMGPG